MKLRTIIFWTIFSIGITPLLTLVAINLKGHMERHEEVEHQRLLAQSKLIQGTLLNSIKYLDADPIDFIPEYADYIWIDRKGTYRHLPSAFLFPELQIQTNKKKKTATHAFRDFPGLQNEMPTNKPFLLNVRGRTFSWLPLSDSHSKKTIFWVGKEIDTSASQKWRQSLIENIFVIVVSTMLLVFFIAKFISSKVDRWQKELIQGLITVLNKEEKVTFVWNDTQEMKDLGNDLTSLCSQYIESRKTSRTSEMELKESENRFRKLTASAQDAIIMMDNNGNTAFWNKAAETTFGYSSEQAIGQPIHSLLDLRRHNSPDAHNSFPQDESKKKQAPVRHETLELTARKQDGNDISIELSLSAAQINEQWHAIWIARDISERKKAEKEAKLRQQQLLQADKMHSLGLLVSGMAHEINNPNSITILNSSMLANAWKSITPVLEDYYQENGDFIVAGLEYSEMREQIPMLLDELEDSGKRVKNIVKDLKDYARQESSMISKDIDLNKVVDKAIRLTNNQIKKATSNFHFHPASHLPLLKGNQQRFEQVVINLIQNACEALQESSAQIKISTSYNLTDRTTQLCVEDQGHGIAKEDLQHVIDPFFTTKRDFGGTGLGLSVSAGIIKRYKGSIDFTSEAGKGTKVTVSFPSAEQTTLKPQ